MIEFPNDIDQVFLFLDRSCNLNCKYCFQRMFSKSRNYEINEDVFTFLESLRKSDNPIVTLYGGEYFFNPNSIKVLEKLSSLGLKLEVISNGTSLTDDLVKILNKHRVCLNLSWDGYNSLKTRNYSVFDDKLDLFLKLECTPRINSIVTRYTYPLDILKDVKSISEKYKAIHGWDVRFHMNMLFNNYLTPEMSEIDTDRVYHDMCEISKMYVREKLEHNRTIVTNCIEPIILRNAYGFYVVDKEKISDSFKCMDGKTNLTMDILGNFYECCDANQKMCTIYDTYDDYYSKMECKELDPRCRGCEILGFCCGFCKLIPEKFKEWHCKVRKSFLSGIRDGLNEYNSRVRS